MRTSPCPAFRTLALAGPALVAILLPGLSLAQVEPAPAPEKVSFWRRLWPAPQEVPQTAAPSPTPSQQTQGAAAQEKVPTGRLSEVEERLAASPLANDPTVQAYLGAIQSGTVTTAQLNAFGIFLADRGLLPEALECFRAALKVDHDNPNLWNNVGTIQQRLGHSADAKASFSKAVGIDPNFALAHYNLGAALDAEGSYDEALAEYTRSLELDPTLRDPRVNPQVVNNDSILAVSMMLYQRQTGALALPLVELPGGALPPKVAPPPAPSVKPQAEKPPAPPTTSKSR